MNKGETVILKIEKLDATGKGIAKPEGFVVFVQGGLPARS
jgi:predicted RNA-binding protein with TRAM domain